jgi:hypothetical protein
MELEPELVIVLIIIFTVVAYLLSYLLANDLSANDIAVPIIASAIALDRTNTTEPNTLTRLDPETGSAIIEEESTFISGNADNTISGGGKSIHKSDNPSKYKIIRSSNYDEYEDEALYEGIDKTFVKKAKYVIVDGNNLIYYYGVGNSYISSIKKSVELVSKIFPRKIIMFVLKDPETEKQKESAIKDMGQPHITNYSVAFRTFSEEYLKKYPKVKIIIAYNEVKSRDDFAVIYLADLLDDSIVLTRDRFTDLKETSMSNTTDIGFKVFGKSHAKYEKILKKKKFPTIGRWSIKNKLLGYVRTKSDKSLVMKKRTNKNSIAGEHVLLIGKD